MEKRARINLFFSIFAGMLLIFLFFPGKALAEDKNPVQLNFVNCSELDTKTGRVTYEIEGAKYCVSLYKEQDYEQLQRVAITSNPMEIDLNEFSYYLQVKAVVDMEDPDAVFPDLAAVRLYLGEMAFDVSSSQSVLLQTEQFSGTLNIELKKKDVAPPGPSYPDEIEIKGTYDGFGMELFLNGERIGNESTSINGIGRGYASGDIYNLIKVQLAFGDGAIGSITVNGTPISLPENVSDELSFAVKPSARYEIVVKKKIVPVPRTVIWDSGKSGLPGWKDDELVKNGTVEILDVRDADDNSLGLKDVTQDLDKNTGYARILPGSKVIFRLTPAYGYQMTSARLGDAELTAGEEKSVFEYIMPDANIVIAGIFEKVENQAKSSAAGVKAAAGYQIARYADLRLEQILYKGTPDAVWADSLDTLQKKATVKLQLDQPLAAGEIMVIYEKQDGTCEGIPAVYDAASQTVTFQTTGFSNYAIAVKKEDSGKTDAKDDQAGTDGKKDSAISGGSESGRKDSATSGGSESGRKETAAAATGRTAPKTGDVASLRWPGICLGLSVLGLLTIRKRERKK